LLRIRLRRTGQKHQPSYRLVVADQNARRDGDFVEIVGHYNPRSEPTEIVVNEERVKYWLGVGAQPSETVHRILHTQGLIAVAPRRTPTKPSRVEREAAAAAEKAAAEARAAAKAEAEAAEKAAAEAAAAAAKAAEEAAAAESADAPAAE
jgi:small subunit ribosomal protein S16